MSKNMCLNRDDTSSSVEKTVGSKFTDDKHQSVESPDWI